MGLIRRRVVVPIGRGRALVMLTMLTMLTMPVQPMGSYSC
jgi:hypothetical protein